MKDITKTINLFLEKYINKKEIIGAIVCGSYITGNPTKHSDIDIYIISNNNYKYSSRSTEYINNTLVEYFIETPDEIKKCFKENIEHKIKYDIHMFLTGKILFDKTGEVKNLIKLAKTYDKRKYKKSNKTRTENIKYYLWDMQDNLEEVFEADKGDFHFVYFNFLDKLLEFYSEYLGFNNIPTYKIRRLLTEKKDKMKFRIQDYPDKQFVKLFINSLEIIEPKQMLKKCQKLTEYITKKLGGFNVDGWKSKTQLKKIRKI